MFDRVQIRRAVAVDAAAIAHVHVASARDAYAPLSPNWQGVPVSRRRELWSSVLEVNADKQPLLVALCDGAIVGFAQGGPARHGSAPASTELYVLHVLPEFRGQGIGDHLWEGACSALRGSERRPLYLNTFAELACCHFYDRHGGRVVARHPHAYWGTDVTELVYLWPAGSPHSASSAATGSLRSKQARGQ